MWSFKPQKSFFENPHLGSEFDIFPKNVSIFIAFYSQLVKRSLYEVIEDIPFIRFEDKTTSEGYLVAKIFGFAFLKTRGKNLKSEYFLIYPNIYFKLAYSPLCRLLLCLVRLDFELNG